MTAKVSLRREKMLGPMWNALWRGDAERSICFVVNLLRKTRHGYGDIPCLVEGVDGWLDQSVKGLRKRGFEPGKIDWVFVQPQDCVFH